MENKKNISKVIVLFVLMIPAILIVNESDYLWINAVGMIWAIALMMFLKYTKYGRTLTKAVIEVGEKYFK